MAETLRHGRRQRTGAKRVDLRKREAQEYLGYNNSDNEENRVLAADVVFLVDNSGSMGEEANAIARDIIDWAEKLAASSLDVRFGCVGYDGGIKRRLEHHDHRRPERIPQSLSGHVENKLFRGRRRQHALFGKLLLQDGRRMRHGGTPFCRQTIFLPNRSKSHIRQFHGRT